MLLFSIVLLLTFLTSGAYVYYFEYLGSGVLYYTIPIALIVSFIAWIILLVIFLWTALLFKRKPGRSKFFYFFTVQVADAIIFLARVKIVLEDFDKLPEDQKFMFVSNHQSLFDAVTLVALLRKRETTFIMKDGLLKIPFVGRWLASSGFYPIDRTNDRNALRTIVEVSKDLEKGNSIAAFPEGTRSTDKMIDEFKSGIFRIAQRAKAPIVVGLVDNFFSIKERYPWRRTKVLVRICDVIDYSEFAEEKTHTISDRVRAIIIENQKEAREKYNFINV